MDLQFYGANCLLVSHKGTRIVVDDNLKELGAKSITKADDVALFTGPHESVNARLTLDSPGEYEVSDISVIGIPSRAHMDEAGKFNATMFKLIVGDISLLVTGHMYPELDDKQLEEIGQVDIMVVPVGGNGYTIDATGALDLIKQVEPKVIIPSHFADNSFKFPVPQQELATALKEMGMEPKETVNKLRLKSSDITDVTQLIILEKS
jgi:L-ascorbate metabolism protein UlaG (beta-lactamase superfamily)